MADLISNSSGNFTAAGTWSLVDATSILDSEANNTATTTSFVSSQSWSYVSAPTVDGIAVKVLSRSGTPTGTFSVRLHDGTAAVAGTTVTINVSDIPAVNTSTNVGWLFMKFAAPVALATATNYTVQVQSSTASQVTLYRNATAANWSRLLRTTTTQAPASTDNLHVCGEFLSAGSSNSFTVTMNNTSSATTYGIVTANTKGTLAYGTAASTNYYLKIAGNLTIYTNGEVTLGTLATPVPLTSTASLEIVCSSNVQFGVECRLGGTLRSGGNPVISKAFLAVDASAGATSLTSNISTGWLSGDEIALASTTRTRAECEKKALTANAAGTALTITALTNAHSGTSPTAAELANLTRNVKIFSASSTNQTYINILSTSVIDLQSTEFYNMGSNTASKRGVDVGITTGSITVNNCSFRDFNVANSLGLNISSGSSNNYIITDNVFYNIAGSGIVQSATTGTNYSISDCLTIFTGAPGLNFSDLGGTISTNTAVGSSGAGIQLSDVSGVVFGTITNLTGHSGGGIGINITSVTGVANNPMSQFSNLIAWRNTTTGITFNTAYNFLIDTVSVFGNTTANISFAGISGNIIVKSATSNAGSTLTCPIGVGVSANSADIYFDTCSFGVTTTHATGDVSITAGNLYPQITFRNCLFNSTTTIVNQTNLVDGAFIASAKHNQVAGAHRFFKKYGTITPDTTIFNRSSPSQRLTPNNSASTAKLKSGLKKFAVVSGQTAVVHVYIRKSVVGDGTAYNGNQPQLVLAADPAVGITSDTVLATTDNTYDGTFKVLTATTPAITDNAVFQVYVSCDGTAGWVNVDDWRVV